MGTINKLHEAFNKVLNLDQFLHKSHGLVSGMENYKSIPLKKFENWYRLVGEYTKALEGALADLIEVEPKQLVAVQDFYKSEYYTTQNNAKSITRGTKQKVLSALSGLSKKVEGLSVSQDRFPLLKDSL